MPACCIWIPVPHFPPSASFPLHWEPASRVPTGSKERLRWSSACPENVSTQSDELHRDVIQKLSARPSGSVGNVEFWTGEFQEGRSQEEFTNAYCEELLQVAEGFHGYSVLAHLDLIRRYDPTPGGPLPFSSVRDIVAEILRLVIADGHGIEVNTSGWRYGLGCPQPTSDVLRLYRDLGGRIVTIGSDSHRPEHLGAYLRLAKDLLKDLGFTQAYTYRRWEPRPYDL